MTNIALVVGDVAHASTAKTRLLFENLGHVVTVFDRTALGTTANFASYALIVTNRLLNGESVADGAAIKALYQTGKPLLLGLQGGGVSDQGNVIAHYLTSADLLGAVEQIGSNSGGQTIINASHPITSVYSVGQAVTTSSSAVWASGLDETGVGQYVGFQLSTNPTSARGNMWAIDAGTSALNISQTLITSKIVIADYLYGGADYSAEAPALTSRIVDWLLLAPEVVAPVVVAGLGQVWPPVSGGSSGQKIRKVAAYVSAALAPGGVQLDTLSLAKSYRLFSISTNAPARVRLYATVAKRDSDEFRSASAAPTGDHGLMLEFVTTPSMLRSGLSPLVDGANMEFSPSVVVPIAVTNLSGTTTSLQVEFTYLETE